MKRATLPFLALAVSIVPAAFAQIAIFTSGSTTQSFDSLVSSGTATWTDNSTISGWFAQRTGTDTMVVAGTGSSNAGDLYSFGNASSSDRALGSVATGTATDGDFAYGILFQNDSGNEVHFGVLSYTGEQWRSGGTTSGSQNISFFYKVSPTTISSLTPGNDSGWTAVSALNFTSPITLATAGPIDGNASGNQASKSFDVNLNIPDGYFVMFRWTDVDDSNSDHGLAIDDFSATYAAIPEPATYAAILGLISLGVVVWRRRRPSV